MDRKQIQFYSKNAEAYADSTKFIRMNTQYELFEKYLPKQPRILDCGFGSGRDTLHFMGLGAEVFAIDITREFVTRLNNAGVINAYCIDFLDAPYNNFFDGVFMNDFLPMFMIGEYQKVFDKLYSLLRAKGICYIATRTNENMMMNGDVKGISYFEDINDINKYINKKFDLMQMSPFIPQNASLENNVWFQYILRKK